MNYKLDVELSPELEAYRDKIEATIEPYIEIQLTNNDKPTWWQSKFGGLPYMPKDFEYPKSTDGEYLYLLAQINFAEVPHLEDFPEKGILQFYIAADEDAYGLDFDNPKTQDKFRVIYFPDVSLNENIVTDFSFLPAISERWLMPFEGCCQVTCAKKLAPISPNDYQFDLFPLFEKEYQEIAEEYYDKFSIEKHKIGGYPDFVQGDPREFYNQEEEPYILLFQIDSDDSKTINICWGDVGIANFFIKKSDLKKLNFSDIVYNWDCS